MTRWPAPRRCCRVSKPERAGSQAIYRISRRPQFLGRPASTSPDALAALVVAHDVLTHSTTQGCTIMAPDLGARLSDRPGRGPRTAAVTSIEEILRQRRHLPAVTGPRLGRPPLPLM